MRFIIIRTLRAFIIIWGVITLTFIATRIAGNPIDNFAPEGLSDEEYNYLMEYFGLNESYFVQYISYFKGIIEGNFGFSYFSFQPVTEVFFSKLPNTLALFGYAFLVSLIIGIPLGIYAAIYRNSILTTFIMALAFTGYAIPNYILAIFAILLFSFTLHLLPTVGLETPYHYIMPVGCLAMSMLAGKIRYSRSAMLDVLNEDYIRTARSKGLSERIVIFKHAFRNASMPIVSILGLQIAGFIAAVVLVEAVFSIDGIGNLIVKAAIFSNYPILQYGVMLWGSIVVLATLLVDLTYALLDPRIRVN